MAQFVAVPAQDIEGFLQQRGFTRQIQGREVTYVRVSARHSSVLMKVYTSIPATGSVVRAAGRDAIRVCVVFDNGRRSFGIGKFSPVLRVQSVASVLQRLQQRLRDAAARANQWIDAQTDAVAAVDAPPETAEPRPPRPQTDDVPPFLAALC